MDLPKLIKNIKTMMFNRNLNQTKLAKKSGVLRVTISNILNSKTEPTLNTIEKLAKALNIGTDSLLNGDLGQWRDPIPYSKMTDADLAFERKDEKYMEKMLASIREMHWARPELTKIEDLDDISLSRLLLILADTTLANVLSAKDSSSMSPEQKALVDLVLKLEPRDIKTFARLVRRRLMGYSRKKQELG